MGSAKLTLTSSGRQSCSINRRSHRTDRPSHRSDRRCQTIARRSETIARRSSISTKKVEFLVSDGSTISWYDTTHGLKNRAARLIIYQETGVDEEQKEYD